jgi:D-alanyl-lipoteichoic acid acyltransferase DltB (MBOAT superfamily)
MLFNSMEFLLFLPIVFALYWAITGGELRSRTGTGTGTGGGSGALRIQNLLLLVASYVFYGWWDWRFLGLIAFSTVVDYFVGLQIASANERELGPEAPAEARSRTARRWLFVSLAVNLGLLGYFKYANFFIESWIDAWAAAGVTMHASSLQIILPVGISFYTFQTLSYSIDIYRRTMPPTRDPIAFAAFVSFFPQLVAGPIERASHLLPQIERRRTFDAAEATTGLRLILWGLFKKVVIADTCALYVNDIFQGPLHQSSTSLALGLIYFGIQIYGDFSGYSDIAIGTARLFGIRLMTNFRTPYFSTSVTEFWRRWHISLSTWFRDYIYFPLGGSRQGKATAIRNTFVVFTVSGLWHGANWNYVIWGFMHALLILPRWFLPQLPKSRWINAIRWTSTYVGIHLIWILFRNEDLGKAKYYILGLLDFDHSDRHLGLLVMVIGFGGLEALHQASWWKPIWERRVALRWSAYFLGAFAILGLWSRDPESFIYFQF